MNRNLYLTEQEEKALRMFTNGCRSGFIRESCGIGRCSMDAFSAALRRKTGITNLKDIPQIEEYFRRYSAVMEKHALTPAQTNALRRVMNSETNQGIAHQLQIPQEQIAQFITDACAAIGIFAQDPRARRTQIRTYLSIYHSTNGKPLTSTDMQVLRLLAKGVRPEELCQHLEGKERYFVQLASKVCLRLGFNAQGRGVRQRMIREYIERFDASAMDDPMF